LPTTLRPAAPRANIVCVPAIRTIAALTTALVLGPGCSGPSAQRDARLSVSDAAVDSRVGEGDSGSMADARVDSPQDAATDAVSACSVPPSASAMNDAGGYCRAYPGVYGNGSDLCTPDQYGLSCGASAAPAPALGCTELALPTPQGVSLYCCPCGAPTSQP
jgi:hypothetical protein